ncbi:MAG TPA: MMPL family transporter [Gemmatimonadales bacterium]|nr:MMPL family transporter [Gemmatimonadales bacterium]
MEWLTRWVVRRRRPVVAAWAALGLGAAIGARGAAERLDVRGGSPHPTEAFQAAELLRTRFSQRSGDPFLVLVSGPAPLDAERPREVLDSLVAALERQPYVREVAVLPTERDPRTAAVLAVLGVSDVDSVLKLVDPLRAAVRRTLAALPDGAAYQAVVTGDAPLERDVVTVATQDVTRSEWRLVLVTGAILVVAFGSVTAAALPLVVGVLAISASLAIIGAVARVTPISIYVLNTVGMIGLGVGIDYSLLLVTRFREETNRGLPPAEAVARTLTTAGLTVGISGITVALGFAALLLTPLTETASIGLGGLVVVPLVVLLSVTLVPALLALLGPRIGRPHPLNSRLGVTSFWSHWARLLERHPVKALLAGGVVLGALTAPLRSIAFGLPARHWWPARTEAGEGLELLTRLGGAGYVQPVRVVVEMPPGRRAVEARALRGLRALSDSLRRDPRVREVRSVVDLRPHASRLAYALLYSDLSAARERYPVFLETFLSQDARVARLDVVPSDTTSLAGVTEVVRRARRLAADLPPTLAGARILVGGFVAQNLDFQTELLRRVPVVVTALFVATLLVLGVVFRSVLIPLKAILLNTLSVSATFGLIVLVFQQGVGARFFGLDGPTDAIFAAVPVLVFAVVFGLSMDYEVFLLSRIKEAFDRTHRTDESTVEGLSATASVISSAALVMITVFGVFAFARVLVIQLLGFGLAVAVLLDATIIRLVLVPAVMHLAGRWNWWPGVRLSDAR